MIEEPNNPSGDYHAMQPYWRKVTSLFGGVETMRRSGYLTQFKGESDPAYKDRIEAACLTNIYRDVVENLAQRPFSEEVALSDESDPALVEFSQDIDGRGNDLHVFAGETFFNGVGYGLDWIYVDYTGRGNALTKAEEIASNARPVWLRYPAESVLAAYSDIIDGREQFVHVRLSESVTRRDGFGEKTIERVRVIDRVETETGYGDPTWLLWQRAENAAKWEVIEEGTITLGFIPLVPVILGRRTHGWAYHPPMQDAAELQIEHFRQENYLRFAKLMTAFPMLVGEGVDNPGEDLAIGPSTVLFTGSSSEGGTRRFVFIEPAATSLAFLRNDLDAMARELRELGRQPLTAQSGNLTVITTAVAAQKGNSAVQSWALGLKDALELALQYTAEWMGLSGYVANVTINTDLGDFINGTESVPELIGMYQTGIISRETLVHELKRRNVLDRDYDADLDLETILAEARIDQDADA